jgi:hypothetical protein
MNECKHETGQTNRTCGRASTYNNAPCRGPKCTEAIRLIRVDQRSAAKANMPKKK